MVKVEIDLIATLLSTEYNDKKKFNNIIRRFKKHQDILKKKLIVKLSNGKKKAFQSFRVEHNDARGPFMGGIRYSSNLNEDGVKELSILESVKSSIVDLPFGGAFGGIAVDQDKIIPKDLKRLSKLYAEFLTKHIGTWKDILFTELGTNQQIFAWMMDVYEKKKRFHSPAVFNSNHHNLDGAVYILTEYLKSTNLLSRFRKIDVAIYGFGNRAYTFAKNLEPQNYRIVAICDSTGGIVNSKGFDMAEVKKLQTKFSSLKEVSVMEKIEFISNEKLLELPVDILVIATDQNTNDKRLNAKLILELANLNNNLETKAEVLPGVLLNSGFNALCHLEWVQKMHGYNWDKEEVSRKLQRVMTKTFYEVKNVVTQKKISYRQASYYLGLKRIVDAMILRG